MTEVAPAAGPPCFTETGLRLRFNRFVPFPRQAAFLATTCREAMFGGTVGGGKSETLLLAALQFVDVPGYNALLIRRTLEDLKGADSLIPMSKALLTGRGPIYNANEHRWTFPSGATLSFGYLRNPDDELRYQGHQYQFVGFDEVTQLGNRDQVLYLHSRLRRLKLDRDEMLAQLGASPDGLTLADVPLRFRCASNPGGPGHLWVWQRYINPATAVAPFLPSSFQENPGLDDDEVREQLALLSEVERRRLEEGDWEIMEIPGALWAFADIGHVAAADNHDVRVMAVDGAVSEGGGDEAGIVVIGVTDGVVDVVEDASLRAHPDVWAKRAMTVYHARHCSRLVVEVNQGGVFNRMILDNAADVLDLPRPNVVEVRAKPGETKEVRAQPVTQAYRAGKVRHDMELRGGRLEAQMVSWVPGVRSSISGSPDRVDALVWAVQHALFGVGGQPARSAGREAMSTWQPSGRAAELMR